MKTYHEQKYTHVSKFKMTFELFGKTETFIEEHKGLNAGHALYLAKRNWLDCSVELIP